MKQASNANKAPALVSSQEEQQVARIVLQHINTCPSLPAGAVRYEHLGAGDHAMAFHTEQSAFKIERYIAGGYRAELRFSLYYRIQPGDSGLARIEADEALGVIGDWLFENPPVLGGRLHTVRLEITRRAAAKTAWDNGDEDHTILLRLLYDFI